LLDPITSFTVGGACDQDVVYGGVTARHLDAPVIVQPRSGAAPSATAKTATTGRDQHLGAITERGRDGRQKASGYKLTRSDRGGHQQVQARYRPRAAFTL
jgi:hypothetical protein